MHAYIHFGEDEKVLADIRKTARDIFCMAADIRRYTPILESYTLCTIAVPPSSISDYIRRLRIVVHGTSKCCK